MLGAEFLDFLQNELFVKSFKDFCQKEFNAENLLFWLEIEAFHSLDPNARATASERIYETYVAIDAQFQINISEAMRNSTQKVNPTPVSAKIFDDLQSHVFDQMKIGSLPRFLKTEAFTNIQNVRENGQPSLFLRLTRLVFSLISRVFFPGADPAKFQQSKITNFADVVKRLRA